MSVQVSVYFRGKLPAKADLQREMQALGFAVLIPPRGGSLERHRAYLPIKLSRRDTGFEFYVDRASGPEQLPPAGIDPGMDRCASLVWGADLMEAAAANAAAAGLACLTGGVMFDDQAGQVRSIEQAIFEAKSALELAIKPDGPKSPVVNDAAIKQLLKPILEMRSDLVLMGKCLFIRPFRHLLRGALITPHRRVKGQLLMWRFVRPLYGEPPDKDPYFMRSPGNFGFSVEKQVGQLYIDGPDIRDMVYEWLVKDIMPWAGKIDTLDKYYDAIAREDLAHSGLETLLLTGKTEQAIEQFRLVELARGQLPTPSLAARRHLFERPVDEVVARLCATEATNVKALKLEPHWQATPFPVELPAAQRASVAEPGFDPAPWPAYSKDWWRKPPETIGQPIFAKSFLYDGMKLVRPLSHDAASREHDTWLEYVLAVRPTGEGIVVLNRRGQDFRLRMGWAKRTDVPPPTGYGLSVWHQSGHLLLSAHFYPRDYATVPCTLMLTSIEIIAIDHTMMWRFGTDQKEGNQCTVLSRPGQPTNLDSARCIPTTSPATNCRNPPSAIIRPSGQGQRRPAATRRASRAPRPVGALVALMLPGPHSTARPSGLAAP